jgi:hypothetical protein
VGPLAAGAREVTVDVAALEGVLMIIEPAR